ncbi:MAG: outer membrane protein romA [Myxococcaceae bacterium]|nr:outer membrane protein romA [Myxococcaceae bacterium]
MARPYPRWLKLVFWSAFALFSALSVVAWVSTDRLRSFGGAFDPASIHSPHFVEGHFQNAEPTSVGSFGPLMGALKEMVVGKQMRSPSCPLPLVTDAKQRLTSPSRSGLRVTWLGHSTTLIELDGATFLTDPIWSERSSPSPLLGPVRFHPPPLALEDLPHLDAVIVSHEHFDHLDMATIQQLAKRKVPFHVPLGVGAHLAAWGVPSAQIHEHDWWQSADIAQGVRLVSTPARHFNGRGYPLREGTFWTSWSLLGPKHRVFFSGDTGLTEGFREIGEREGPFDLALFEIGQYHPSWGEIHLGPAGALQAHRMLGAKVLLPIHWATFELAVHDWNEPPETLLDKAGKAGVTVVTPLLGEPLEPTERPRTHAWWRAYPPIAKACPVPAQAARR